MRVYVQHHEPGSGPEPDDGLRARIIANENGGTDRLLDAIGLPLLIVGCEPYETRYYGRNGKIVRHDEAK